MKVTRSYWLGLGSGLILSAMLALVITPLQGQAVGSQETSSASLAKQQTTTQPFVAGAKQTDSLSEPQPSAAIQPPASTQPSQGQSPNPQTSTQIEQKFIVPKGASSEQIAELLLAQGFIKDKDSFLVVAHQLGVESKFRAGAFTLSPGLTSEELIHRLTK
ncbi:endolytic transglycosylase MltG [Desulfosporosinus sp. OT]|uniref:endolytic transglycosylase MltG n=1 Tax=Desulfosporosinus sp. OT TaxID=913865 RepID=UPI000223A5BC|nr:endolytic transglycosylase MltG [Desulfosporosinus sp. OT]EGW39828.1 hypothetical protein DOT_2201 [Desulfosporosinus sp. OT]